MQTEVAKPCALYGRQANAQDLLYSELEFGLKPLGRPKLRFKDVCKSDMEVCVQSGTPGRRDKAES